MAELPGRDNEIFRTRGNLQTTNANLYIANNNNPFLVSPYSPPTVAATKAAITTLSSLISTQIGNLSSVINLNTFTLSISTIRPVPSDASQTITIQASTLNIDGAFPSAVMNVSMSSFYNTINTNYLTVNSTLSVSTITGNTNFVNLYGTDIIASTLTVSSFVTISTLSVTGNTNFVNLYGTDIIASTLTVSSLTTLSTLSVTGSTLTTQFIFSSIVLDPTTGFTAAPLGAYAGYIPIAIGPTAYKLAIYN
jgi:hypothetical protein